MLYKIMFITSKDVVKMYQTKQMFCLKAVKKKENI